MAVAASRDCSLIERQISRKRPINWRCRTPAASKQPSDWLDPSSSLRSRHVYNPRKARASQLATPADCRVMPKHTTTLSIRRSRCKQRVTPASATVQGLQAASCNDSAATELASRCALPKQRSRLFALPASTTAETAISASGSQRALRFRGLQKQHTQAQSGEAATSVDRRTDRHCCAPRATPDSRPKSRIGHLRTHCVPPPANRRRCTHVTRPHPANRIRR
jgi:hypothetical protein